MRKFQFLVIPMILVSFLSASGQENTKAEDAEATLKPDKAVKPGTDDTTYNRLARMIGKIPNEMSVFFKDGNPNLDEFNKLKKDRPKMLGGRGKDESDSLYDALALLLADGRCGIQAIRPVGTSPNPNSPITLPRNLSDNGEFLIEFKDGPTRTIQWSKDMLKETDKENSSRSRLNKILFGTEFTEGFYSQILTWKKPRSKFCSRDKDARQRPRGREGQDQ